MKLLGLEINQKTLEVEKMVTLTPFEGLKELIRLYVSTNSISLDEAVKAMKADIKTALLDLIYS